MGCFNIGTTIKLSFKFMYVNLYNMYARGKYVGNGSIII